MLANCSLDAWKMSGADPEAPEKQALREKSQSQETSSCQAFAGFTGSWAAQESRHPPPGTPPRGTEFGLQGLGYRFSPLPQMHREYRLPSFQSVLSPGSAWGGCDVSGEGSSGEPRGRQSSPKHNFSHTWKFSVFLSFSLLPVLTLVVLLQGAGSDLPEARSTCHLLLIFVCNQF